MNKSWQEEANRILTEINRLFDEEKVKTKTGKNLELVRIFLPEEEYKFLEKLSDFKRLHNLGGIPVSLTKEDLIKIDVETVNPRKRKRKTVIYVKDP